MTVSGLPHAQGPRTGGRGTLRSAQAQTIKPCGWPRSSSKSAQPFCRSRDVQAVSSIIATKIHRFKARAEGANMPSGVMQPCSRSPPEVVKTPSQNTSPRCADAIETSLRTRHSGRSAATTTAHSPRAPANRSSRPRVRRDGQRAKQPRRIATLPLGLPRQIL